MVKRHLTKVQQELFLKSCADSVKNHQGRMTSARQSVFEALADAEGPLGAYELYERAKKNAKTIDVTTVYRNLEFLANEGLVHESGSGGWIACGHLRGSCGSLHVLVKCETCGRVEESCAPGDVNPIKALQLEARSLTGFKASAAIILGRCPGCVSC